MIQLIKGQSKDVIVTLTELTTLANAYYLFVFTHETTKAVINVIKNSTSDLSSFKYRYNKFTFASGLFSNASIGKYNYSVFEQLSSSNTNTTGLNLIESGKMDLNVSTIPVDVFNEYSAPTTFSTYAG
jgi:hypothetical protein